MASIQAERIGSMCDSARIHVNELLALLSKSKMLHILYTLNCDPKPMRFSEIKRRVDSSSTTVTRILGELEQHELVIRTVYPTVPSTVEYSLTPAAIALRPSLESLFDWVLDFANELQN